jgi:antitoxin MazE
METKLIKIGNSFGVRIPKSMIKQYELSEDIEIDPTESGILIKAKKKARAEWGEKLEQAIGAGHQPDGELLEGFDDELTDIEWQW